MVARRRDEQGAVAIMVAVLMVVLVSAAALAVDLGNAWARLARVQSQVDAVAMAGGGELPVAVGSEVTVRGVVADFFNRDANLVIGQAGAVTAAQLGDSDLSNGEVVFDEDGRVTMPDGTDAWTRMTVTAPEAEVDYGLAEVMGPEDGQVAARAVVELRTKLPPKDDVLPMWLPAGCAYGAVSGDTEASTPPSASPSWPTTTPAGTHAAGSLTPSGSVYAQTSVDFTLDITGIPADRTWAVVRFTFGAGKYRDYLVTWDTPTSGATSNRTVEFTADVEATGTNPITSTAGTWQVWAMLPDTERDAPADIAGAGSLLYPQSSVPFMVNGGGTVACAESQRGNFGQMESPRAGVTQKQKAYAANVRFGMDHALVAFANATGDQCTSDGAPAGARIDNVSRPGNNCLYVDPGNDPNGLTDGLLAGVTGVSAPSSAAADNPSRGRLTAVTTSGCGRAAGSVGGYAVNNDTLSCYLRPGYSLGDIARSGAVPADALDPAILDSPRFFYAPVVYAEDRELKQYLAIKDFVPVFLTDESELSTKAATDATAANGITVNSGGKVQGLQLFAFNAEALPKPPNGETAEYVPGTQGVPQLVD